MAKNVTEDNEKAILLLGKASKMIQESFFLNHESTCDMEEYPEYIAAQNSIRSIATGIAYKISERKMNRLFFNSSL